VLVLAALAAAVPVGIEPVVATGPDGAEQVYFRIRTEEGTIENLPVTEPSRTARADTGVLWVDRSHQNAIAQSIAISNDGHHIFTNWYLNNERASYYRTLGTQAPVWAAPGKYPWAYGGQQIGVSRDGGVMGLSAASGAVKWSRSSRYPDWVFSYPALGNGFTRVSRTGNRVVTCQNGVLTALRERDRHVVWTAEVPEPTRLQGIDISDNGHIVAVTVYDSCIIFDEGVRRAAIPIGTSSAGTQYAAAISGDGSMLVTGDYYGYLKLYAWDSTNQRYNMKWQASVGTPWVAGVAISRDGSKVACGTGYANGKLCVFDSSSATPVMVYQGYGSSGAYVASVALSADGGRVAAASWGDIAPSGTFRVLTVHNTDGDTTPLVAVTRNDEPGSLFACDISDDGQYVTASGKAVHAQQMGNGGQVYAILVGAAESRNVGVAAALAPGRHVRVGVSSPVSWRVINYGDSSETFYSHVLITNSADSLLRHDSTLVSALAAGATRDLATDPFLPPAYDTYVFTYYTALDGDEYRSDDTTFAPARCFHDGTPVWIRPPGVEQTVRMTFVPRVGVCNNGSYHEAMAVKLTITDSAGTVVYEESTTTSAIPADDTVAVALPSATLGDVGPHTATALVSCTDDFYPANDTFRLPFLSTYEIIYDDGVPEAYYWVGRRDNDKFYLRFTPTVAPPFSVRHGRFYVNLANTPFDYVMVCPDAAGLPDTANPLQTVYNVSAPVAPGWAEFQLNVTRTTDDDFWLICHWPDGSPAVGIGADATPPIDLRSYFSSNQDPFRQWTTHDWMMRLTQSFDVGAAERPTEPRALKLHAARPNPFARQFSLGYEVPMAGRVLLRLFDASGRAVATLVDAERAPGRYSVTVGNRIASIPSGLYFARLTQPLTGVTRVQKLVKAD